MGFALPGTKTLKSGADFARQVIPADVRDEYQRIYGKRHEERWRAEPGTPVGERKRLFSEWLAEFYRRVEAIRAAQRGDGIELNRKDALALAGEWYVWFTERYENDPGRPELWAAEQWSIIDAMLKYAPDHVREEPIGGLGWTRDPDVRAGIRPVITDRGFTAQFLASRGIALTNEARAQFLDAVLDNYLAGLSLLESRARGDYSPDALPKQFPKFTAPSSRREAPTQSPWGFFESWVSARQPAKSTISRWRGVFENLECKLAGPDAQPLTNDTAQAWAKELITAKRSARTVRDVWVNAAQTVYAWAKTERLIDNNPFEGLPITVPRVTKLRETDAFTADEARTILRAAANVGNTSSAFAAAKRWVPWLCAYSGARVGEITQLRGADIVQRGQFHVMRITPEAGTTKTRTVRTVPLHDHLIAQGFLEFVRARGKGPLFYEKEDASDTTSPDDPMRPKRPRAVKARERLAGWVRDAGVTDREVQPNHAWRDTFKQIAERHGISERTHDAISGSVTFAVVKHQNCVGLSTQLSTPNDVRNGLCKI
jgi:integrase